MLGGARILFRFNCRMEGWAIRAPGLSARRSGVNSALQRSARSETGLQDAGALKDTKLFRTREMVL